MGVLSFLAAAALLFIGSSISSFEAVSAQNVSAPLDPTSASVQGQSVYVFSPTTGNVAAPNGYGGLVAIPSQYADSTMQWVVEPSGDGISYTISSASSPGSSGCDTSAYWNAPKKSPLRTVCSLSDSLYDTFIFVASYFYYPDTDLNYVIKPFNNPSACVTDIGGVLTTPATACNQLGTYTQWQFVTISN